MDTPRTFTPAHTIQYPEKYYTTLKLTSPLYPPPSPPIDKNKHASNG